MLFFASILLHELGHAIQAQREGIPTDGITLWVFGGVASLRGQIPPAGAELRVAIPAPAESLIIGAVGAALALSMPDAVDGMLFWLGQVNLYLLGFNLIPRASTRRRARAARPPLGPAAGLRLSHAHRRRARRSSSTGASPES